MMKRRAEGRGEGISGVHDHGYVRKDNLLNVLCYRMATAELNKQHMDDDVSTLSSPLCPRNLTIEVRYGQQVISAHYVARLREAIAAKEHRQFLQNKYKWTD